MKAANLFDLSGQVAIVTGGSRGIGAAIAVRMAQHGAKVVVASRKIEACELVVQRIEAAGGEAFAMACNIGRKADLEVLVTSTLGRWGRVDALVCNAAVNPYYGPTIDMPDDVFTKIMDSNVRSNLWLASLVHPTMVRQGGGTVLIISSIAGLRGHPALGGYAISKAADMALARNLAVEWGPKNIRANCIAPGLIRTDFAKALWANEGLLRKRTIDTPLQRIGEPDDIAGAVVFLASAAGRFMTGQTIVIDGGVTSGSPVLESE